MPWRTGMSKQKFKTVRSKDGSIFELTAERLRQIDSSTETWFRAVTRKQVREALQYTRQSFDGYFSQITSGMNRRIYRDIWLAKVSVGLFSIGCKTFIGSDYETISKWAWRRKRKKASR